MAEISNLRGGSTPAQSMRPQNQEDWEAQRERIAGYYLQDDLTLESLRATMLQRHSFNATKRQYCAKLKQWELRKYLTASEKELLVDEIVTARLSGRRVAGVRLNGRELDLKSLLKHIKSQVPRSNKERDDGHVSRLQDNFSPGLSTVPGVDIVFEDSETSQSNLSEEDSEVIGRAVFEADVVHTSAHHARRDKSGGHSTALLHPSLTYQPTRSSERILALSRDYILFSLESGFRTSPSQLGTRLVMFPEAPIPESAALRQFWVNTKNALYMAKKHLKEETFDFTSRACAAIQSPAAVETSLGTLKDVLATLSPTNTNACLPLRDHLLYYLSQIFAIRFGMTHPLVLLCAELRKDVSNQEIHETALRRAIEVIETDHWAQPSDANDFRRELIRLLRRAGDLQQSERVCIKQEDFCVQNFSVDSFFTRRARTDRVHVLMAKGELTEAMEISEAGIASDRRILGASFPDELAVYALEDLGELCKLRENPGRCSFLLHEAYFGAARLWGTSASSTEYILLKIKRENQHYLR